MQWWYDEKTDHRLKHLLSILEVLDVVIKSNLKGD